MSNVIPMPVRHEYLYIMAMDGYAKIGVSKDPYKRLKQIQTGSPRPVKIAFMCRFDGSPYPIEKNLHLLMARHNTNLEWFLLPEDTIMLVNMIPALAWLSHELVVLDVKSDYYAFYSADGFRDENQFLVSGFPEQVHQLFYEECFPNGEDMA